MNLNRTIEAFLAISCVDLAIRLFRVIKVLHTIEHLSKLTIARNFSCVPAEILIKSHERAIRLYPRHIQCLERSVSLFLLMKLHRQPATFQIGVRKVPFASHAWVSRDGITSPDDVLLVSSLTPILTIE